MLGWLLGRIMREAETVVGVEHTVPRPRSRNRNQAVYASFGDLRDLKVLRNQSLRALCGVLMDQHSDCLLEAHPFCGPKDDGNAMRLVAQATQQRTGTNAPLIGVYFYPAQGPATGPAESPADGTQGEQGIDPLVYAARLSSSQPEPTLKLVVSPRDANDGKYPALFGPVSGAVGGDIPGGSLAPGDCWSVDCDPSPAYCRWHYWESEIPLTTGMLPRFHCLQISGEWWIVESYPAQGVAQQVAALDLADNPNHDPAPGG